MAEQSRCRTVSSGIYSVSALTLLGTSCSTTCLLREYQDRLEMGRRCCLEQASSLVSGLAWPGVEKVPLLGSELLSALLTMAATARQTWTGFLRRAGSFSLWKCSPRASRMKQMSTIFSSNWNENTSFQEILHELLFSWVPTRVCDCADCFSLCADSLGKVGCEGQLQAEIGRGSWGQTSNFIEFGKYISMIWCPRLGEIDAFLEHCLGWHRSTSMICWHQSEIESPSNHWLCQMALDKQKDLFLTCYIETVLLSSVKCFYTSWWKEGTQSSDTDQCIPL